MNLYEMKRRGTAEKLRALALVMLTLAAGAPAGYTQQQAAASAAEITPTDKQASALPAEPAPVLSGPLWLRPSPRDFSKPFAPLWGNPIKPYMPTTLDKANFSNSVRLTDLVKDGKIYLSLSDAIALALENNYDIAIERYYLDIADLDYARAKSGGTLRGVGATTLQNTIGGTSQTLSSSGAPGTVSGATAGASGIVITSDGAGPTPENRDPNVQGTIQLERAESVASGPFSPRAAWRISTTRT